MATLACAGNTMVLLGRLVSREPNPVHSLYIKTLALADLMMGVYLLVIAVMDWHYRDIYVKRDFEWRHSSTCNACGQFQPNCLTQIFVIQFGTQMLKVQVCYSQIFVPAK
jgi:hypothetical protein